MFVFEESEAETMPIDLISYKHHTRRMKICDDNLASGVRDWVRDFKDQLRMFRSEGWEEKLTAQIESDPATIIVLNGCRF